ncbi:MAG TPA: response regulator [Sandaracinaceae bacterium LLY-WYZ-13_1]|nr:response regulator [Sandaracinaceae bacterium LLY-WYZ-13_1]
MSQRSRHDVWVVEDDRALMQGLLTLMGEHGFRTRGFTDPSRALREALRRPPRVLVTDYKMPGLDGVELARRLREELGPEVPRLYLVSGERLRRVELTHFDQVMRKPFRFHDLLAIIDRNLAGPRRPASHRRMRRVGPRSKAVGGEDR